ncbi:MAG: hypothetical protein JO345_24700 [Streptosporangiaceae bacterium]|nr:hypothetical protein [Streptosporangiaceae bacterium]
MTFLGYIVTRATPVPGDQDDFGNWGEPLGVASLVIEAILVILAVWALTGRHQVRTRHLVQEAKAVTPGLSEDVPPPRQPSDQVPQSHDPSVLGTGQRADRPGGDDLVGWIESSSRGCARPTP